MTEGEVRVALRHRRRSRPPPPSPPSAAPPPPGGGGLTCVEDAGRLPYTARAMLRPHHAPRPHPSRSDATRMETIALDRFA
ncbi:hypothetical protein WR25_19079 [Diploscapter pachys]|uniref:Uncharacterized protein n=1 Tax=Diploscapter pachys TaxID=2018661 RepID=A0A2A2M3K6_9BILA|nr:hypothetical protein WR25_19079 [Diploscapter pachys]